MRITLAQLRLLLAVAEAGSIGTAARRCGLTQSGASQALIALERAIGRQLLNRGRDGVNLTAFAQEILADAATASQAVARIEAHAEIERPPARHLRLAAVPSVAANLLPSWCRRFRALHPETNLTIFEGHHLEVADWVMRGIADLGFAAFSPEMLVAEQIGEQRLVVVARIRDKLLRRSHVRVADLSNARLVTAGLGCEPIIRRVFVASDLALPPLLAVHDIATALEMVRQGVGLTILPESALQRSDMHDLRFRPFQPEARRPLYVLTRPGEQPADAFRTIVRGDVQIH